MLLPFGGQSEEGVETDDVVEEEGYQEDCGHLVMRVIGPAMLNTFIILVIDVNLNVNISPLVYIILALDVNISPLVFIIFVLIVNITPLVLDTFLWFVEFDRQVNVGEYVSGREEDVEDHDSQDRGHQHL